MNYEEKQLTSQCVYDGKIMQVQRDEVELATGKKSFREVVRHSGGVVILALKENDTVLMVKQFRYPIKEIMFELPAGKLEAGEDPFEAAKRELEEETGYSCQRLVPVTNIYPTPGYCDEVIHLYHLPCSINFFITC